MKPGVWPFAKNGFRALNKAEMSCEDTQHKHKMYAHAYFRKYAPEYAKAFANAVTQGAVIKRRLHRQFSFRRLDWCYTIKLLASLT